MSLKDRGVSRAYWDVGRDGGTTMRGGDEVEVWGGGGDASHHGTGRGSG